MGERILPTLAYFLGITMCLGWDLGFPAPPTSTLLSPSLLTNVYRAETLPKKTSWDWDVHRWHLRGHYGSQIAVSNSSHCSESIWTWDISRRWKWFCRGWGHHYVHPAGSALWWPACSSAEERLCVCIVKWAAKFQGSSNSPCVPSKGVPEEEKRQNSPISQMLSQQPSGASGGGHPSTGHLSRVMLGTQPKSKRHPQRRRAKRFMRAPIMTPQHCLRWMRGATGGWSTGGSRITASSSQEWPLQYQERSTEKAVTSLYPHTVRWRSIQII